MTQTQPFASAASVPSPVQPSDASSFALTLLGPSSAMAQLWSQVRRLAPHVRTVLLIGEAHCGQEAVARLLLDLSPLAHRSFVHLTAAEAESRLLRPNGLSSLPVDLFLFLPEVDRLSLVAQEALLRLMRQRRSRHFTVVAAATEDLRSLVSAGRFSAELADALHSIRIALPSLRQRAEDLPMLLNHLFAACAGGCARPVPQPTQEFLRAAMQYAWPENLRELQQTVAHLCATATQRELGAADLQAAIASSRPVRPSSFTGPVRLVSLDTVMQEHIALVLRACQGNKLRAAEVLGISRSTLYRMLDAAAVQNTPFSLAS